MPLVAMCSISTACTTCLTVLRVKLNKCSYVATSSYALCIKLGTRYVILPPLTSALCARWIPIEQRLCVLLEIGIYDANGVKGAVK